MHRRAHLPCRRLAASRQSFGGHEGGTSMKIGMLSQWYDPETGPAALPGVYAREFASQGHQVSVLTGFPNYPHGHLYPGYSIRPRTREGAAPLRVTRTALYPNHSSSTLGRIANYASFGASATIFGGRALRHADAIWVFNSPVTVSAPLLTHSRFGRTPIFLHVQDIWPDSLIESGMFPGGFIGKAAEHAIAALVRLTERRSAVIGVISESVRDLILERNPGIDRAKIVYAPNPANERVFRPVSELRAVLDIGNLDQGVTEIMYAGAIGEFQGLDTVIETASILKRRQDIQFTIVGDGTSRERLARKAQDLGLTNIHFTGRVPQDEIPCLVARADIQMVSLAASPFLAYTTPSKISSLLASGVPVVAQLEGDGANLLTQSGAASVVVPGDPERFADAVCSLVDAGPKRWDEMGKSGRRYYEENLSVNAAASRIIEAIRAAGVAG